MDGRVLSDAVATIRHLIRRRDKRAMLVPTLSAVFFLTIVLSNLDHSPYGYGLAAFRSLVSSTLILSNDQYLAPPPPPKMLSLAETISMCYPLTNEEQYEQQIKMLASYESSEKQYPKMASDVRDLAELNPRHAGILHYLTTRVLRPQWSILDLGSGTGDVLREIQDYYIRLQQQQDRGAVAKPSEEIEFMSSSVSLSGQVFVGVEILDNYIQESELVLKPRGIDMFQGDITDFELPEPYEGATFDFIMLNDVVEHVQRGRFGCLFLKLQELTHSGSLVYIHTPTAEAQLYRHSFPSTASPMADDAGDANSHADANADSGTKNNNDEGKDRSRLLTERSNVLPHHFLFTGMAMAGFELVEMEMDTQTNCGGRVYHLNRMPQTFDMSTCNIGGYVKYSHMLFRRASDQKVFEID